MLLPTDPETLRVPAFLRKRSLSRRDRRPLILTAFDRKQAGIPPLGIKKRATKRKKKAVFQMPIQDSIFEAPIFHVMPESRARVTREQKNPAPRKIAYPSTFSEPFLDYVPAPTPKATIKKSVIQKSSIRKIGKITHYYDKIQVAVLLLTDSLSVGDCITYPTEEGPYEQVVESMEIDRNPIFKAARGEEIGMKFKKAPIVGGKVTQQIL